MIFRIERLRGPVLAVLGVIYTIPSLSLLVLLIPLTGLSPLTAIIVLVAYAQLVLVRNTLAGLMSVDPAIVEAARGMGMKLSATSAADRAAIGLAGDPGRGATGDDCDHRHRHDRRVYQRWGAGSTAVRRGAYQQLRQDRGRGHCGVGAGDLDELDLRVLEKQAALRVRGET